MANLTLIPTGLHCLLVGGIYDIVTCGKPGMAGSLTHDEGRGGRSVTGV